MPFVITAIVSHHATAVPNLNRPVIPLRNKGQPLIQPLPPYISEECSLSQKPVPGSFQPPVRSDPPQPLKTPRQTVFPPISFSFPALFRFLFWFER